jgi:hypothetical protein
METKNLESYYPGYDEYLKPKEEENTEEDVDNYVDEMRLRESEN